MKKTIAILLTLCLILPAVVGLAQPVSAAGATLGFSTQTLRAGDSFKVTLTASLENAITVNGTFSHSSNVSLTSVAKSTGTLDVNGNAIFVDLGSDGITGQKAVAVATFKVSASAKTGETVSVSFAGNYSNLGGDYPISGSASVKVAAPLSANCDLGSMILGNATLSPTFHPDTFAYSAGEVDFAVSALDIQAVAADGKAKVSISGNSLAVGQNTVTVTVKAENGGTQKYTITVTRKQDPNYVPSDNTALAGITVDGFVISPPFQNGVDTYIVWLPYETQSIAVSATPADSKASVSVSGGSELTPGADNPVTVTCTAENGTKKDYILIAKRAAAHGQQPTQPPTEPGTEPTEPITQPAEPQPAPPQPESVGIGILTTVILCTASCLLGAGTVFVILTILKNKKDKERSNNG